MSYGIIYQTQWDSIPRPGATVADSYYAKIYKKDYTDTITNVVASGKPVIHQWQTDDPHVTIKGSNLTFTLVNTGLLPLSNFFSVDDDTFKLEYFWNDQMLFTGFLVQTDCTEIQTDIAHTIELSFTDNLGLLKDVTIQQAASLLGPFVEYTDKLIEFNGPNIIWFYLEPMPVAIGDVIQISGSGVADGNWTVVNFVDPTPPGLPVKVQVAETLSPWFGGVPCLIHVITPIDLTVRRPFAVYLRLCLLSTNLRLNTEVYGNLNADGMPTPSYMFEDAYIDGQTFLNGNTWQSCYDVLTEILTRFNCSLMQANGTWNIIRFDELRGFGGQIKPILYVPDFVRVEGGRWLETLTYGNGSDIQAGLLESIIRPYKYDKETFNYRFPTELIKNKNFTILGSLVSTTIVGGTTVYEYHMPDWFPGFAPNGLFTGLIRVIIDTVTGVEIERYARITNSLSGDDPRQWRSTSIDVNTGDRFEYTFSFKTNASQAGPVTITFAVENFDGTTTLYVDNDGNWAPTLGFSYSILSGDNTNQWHSVTIKSDNIPLTGILNVYMAIATSNSAEVTYYKDLNFTYTPAVSGQINIIGQTHTQTQPGVINNRGEDTMLIDDSPRNSISGTIFLASFTGVLQNRTLFWNRSGISEAWRLGQITTYEKLYWHRKQRIKLEGNLLGLVHPATVSFSVHAVFVAPHQITFSLASTDVLSIVVGSVIVVTGSGSNDGTYNVTAVAILFGTFTNIYTATVAETVVNEDVDPVNVAITTRQHLTALSLINYIPKTDMHFVFGMLSINYKENQANGTLYEQWDTGEVDSDLKNQYQFQYLYDNKNQ